MLLTAILIKIDSKGTILFKQQRPGTNGTIFTIYKFRTMGITENANGTETNRITRIGKYLRKLSIDELPQLYNILKGDMSFIGPRPLLIEYLVLYSDEQKRRHEVRPGISGWAQVKGRNSISWDEKFHYDLEYVNKVSFLFDIKILALTLVALVKRSGIDNSEAQTMPLFTGK